MPSLPGVWNLLMTSKQRAHYTCDGMYVEGINSFGQLLWLLLILNPPLNERTEMCLLILITFLSNINPFSIEIIPKWTSIGTKKMFNFINYKRGWKKWLLCLVAVFHAARKLVHLWGFVSYLWPMLKWRDVGGAFKQHPLRHTTAKC